MSPAYPTGAEACPHARASPNTRVTDTAKNPTEGSINNAHRHMQRGRTVTHRMMMLIRTTIRLLNITHETPRRYYIGKLIFPHVTPRFSRSGGEGGGERGRDKDERERDGERRKREGETEKR